jgi:ABC-type glycerol-3-phosphate transport system substrate-binding protein
MGLNIPKTWTEFVDVARKLTRDTNGDGKVDRWAFSMVGSRNNSGETRYMLISKSFGADEIYLDGKIWKTDIEKPEFKAGLKLFTDLYTQYGVVPPGPVEVDYSASMTLFTTEQTGMILSGPHSLGFITKQNPNLDGKLGSFVIPQDKQHISISGIGGYTITNTSKIPEIAADYMKFLTSKENAIPFGQKTGRMPTRTDAANDPFFKSPLFSGFLEAMNYCVEQETFPAYPALCDTIGEAYSTILSGSATLDSAYETLKTKAARIIAEHN